MPPSTTFQQVVINGIIDKDPEIRALSAGTPVANLTVLTEDGYKDKQGEWKVKKEWHKVVVFGQNVANLSGAKKGDRIFILGKNETRSYESDGVKKFITEVKAEKISLAGGVDSFDAPPPPRTAARSELPPQARAVADDMFITDDDIPF